LELQGRVREPKRFERLRKVTQARRDTCTLCEEYRLREKVCASGGDEKRVGCPKKKRRLQQRSLTGKEGKKPRSLQIKPADAF